jgi:hypothetical protein
MDLASPPLYCSAVFRLQLTSAVSANLKSINFNACRYPFVKRPVHVELTAQTLSSESPLPSSPAVSITHLSELYSLADSGRLIPPFSYSDLT